MNSEKSQKRLVDMTLGELLDILAEREREFRLDIFTSLRPDTDTAPVQSAPATDSDVISIDDAATLINRSRETVYHMTSRRQIPHYKRNGRLVFRRSELEAWLCGVPVPTMQVIEIDANKYLLKHQRNG